MSNQTASSSETVAQAECAMPVPRNEHERLQPFVGKFRAEVKMWMGLGEPMVQTGTMTTTRELSGLYLQQDYVGDPGKGPFSSFEGKGFWGYNTTQNRYEGFWIDNASTTMQFEHGEVDASGKIWEMKGEMICPQSHQPFTKRSVISLFDEDSNRIEMYFTGADGNEMKCMEINYSRIA
jgi:hypothetical protein